MPKDEGFDFQSTIEATVELATHPELSRIRLEVAELCRAGDIEKAIQLINTDELTKRGISLPSRARLTPRVFEDRKKADLNLYFVYPDSLLTRSSETRTLRELADIDLGPTQYEVELEESPTPILKPVKATPDLPRPGDDLGLAGKPKLEPVKATPDLPRPGDDLGLAGKPKLEPVKATPDLPRPGDDLGLAGKPKLEPVKATPDTGLESTVTSCSEVCAGIDFGVSLQSCTTHGTTVPLPSTPTPTPAPTPTPTPAPTPAPIPHLSQHSSRSSAASSGSVSSQQEIRAALEEVASFVETPSFRVLLHDLGKIEPSQRPDYVRNVILDPAELSKRSIYVPSSLKIQRSAFGDNRPTLFCVAKDLNQNEKVTITFNNV